MSFDQNGPFFKLVTLRVRAQPAPGRSCILSSGLVTTKNRRPSAEAGLSPPLREATGRERGSRPRPRPCGCCRQWARSRAGLGVQRVGWGPPPTPAPLPAPGLRSLRGWGPGGGLAGSEASARLPGAGRQVAGSRSRPRATRGERGPLAPGRAALQPGRREAQDGRRGRFCPGARTRGSGRAELCLLCRVDGLSLPGSECCRGRWKFLRIKHGAEARGLFGLAALPPHPGPGPHSSPGRHSCRPPAPPPALLLLARSRAAETPSPGLEEAAG